MNYWICICRKENDDCEYLNEWLWDSHSDNGKKHRKYKNCFEKINKGDKVLCYRKKENSWYEFVIDCFDLKSFTLSEGKKLEIDWEATLRNTSKILDKNPKKYYAFQKNQAELKFVQATLAKSSETQFRAIYESKTTRGQN